MPVPGNKRIIRAIGRSNRLQNVAAMKRAKKKRNNIRKMKR